MTVYTTVRRLFCVYSEECLPTRRTIIKDIPFIGSILSGHPVITYLAFIMIFLMYVVMYHTKFGIYVRVVGESEEAAKAIGLHTDFYKYAAILLGAVGCALGGMNLSLERLGLYGSRSWLHRHRRHRGAGLRLRRGADGPDHRDHRLLPDGDANPD